MGMPTLLRGLVHGSVTAVRLQLAFRVASTPRAGTFVMLETIHSIILLLSVHGLTSPLLQGHRLRVAAICHLRTFRHRCPCGNREHQ